MVILFINLFCFGGNLALSLYHALKDNWFFTILHMILFGGACLGVALTLDTMLT